MAAFSAGASGAGARRGPHRDDGGRRHEEIYIVLEGRAGFMLHGEELDAPAGTFVRVDVAVRRRAVALQPGTSVLALGGPPSFEPSASEWIERARRTSALTPQRPGGSWKSCAALDQTCPAYRSPRSCLAVGAGDTALAERKLHEVLQEEPGLRTALSRDPDLAPLLD
jgi:hypothetical protein